MKPRKIIKEVVANPGTAVLAGWGAARGLVEITKQPDSEAGTKAWIALGLGVLAWDVIAPETLSHAFTRGLEHPRYKYMCVGLLGATALHLMGYPK